MAYALVTWIVWADSSEHYGLQLGLLDDCFGALIVGDDSCWSTGMIGLLAVCVAGKFGADNERDYKGFEHEREPGDMFDESSWCFTTGSSRSH